MDVIIDNHMGTYKKKKFFGIGSVRSNMKPKFN
jgi:hypothetical protein